MYIMKSNKKEESQILNMDENICLQGLNDS